MFHCHSFPGSKRVKFLLPPGKDRWRNATPISLGLSWSLTKPHFGIGAAPSTFTMVYRGICQVILPKKNMDEGMTQRKVFAWVAIHLAIRKKKSIPTIPTGPAMHAIPTWPKVWKAKSAPSARGLPTAPHTSVKHQWGESSPQENTLIFGLSQFP